MNKAEYTATPVVYMWAGIVTEKFLGNLGRSSVLKKIKNAKRIIVKRLMVSSTRALPQKVMVEVEGEAGQWPKEVDDLCFHTGEFYPPPPPLSPPPNLHAHISASKPISQPLGQNPNLEAQIPLGWNLGLGDGNLALRWDLGLKTGI